MLIFYRMIDMTHDKNSCKLLQSEDLLDLFFIFGNPTPSLTIYIICAHFHTYHLMSASLQEITKLQENQSNL